MGKLAMGLGRWVRSMNMPEGDERNKAVAAAFKELTEAWLSGRRTWDASDRLAAEILEAFDRSRGEDQ